MKHSINGKSASEIEYIIDEYIVGYKAQRNRDMMKEKFIEGLTFEEIAEKHDMSPRGVVKIIYKCLDIISERIEG